MFDVATLPFAGLSVVDVEKMLINHPPASCPVIHRFGPSIYIRELHMSAGTMAVGKLQKFEHINILLKGKVIMFNSNGTTSTLEAPLFYVDKPGRKVAFILEDTVWQNVYATEETDVDKLEDYFLENSDVGRAHEAAQFAFAKLEAQNDNDDYELFLEETNLVGNKTNSTYTLVDLQDISMLRISDSPIHGKGIYTTTPIYKDELITQTHIGNNITAAWKYINHSAVPNCTLVIENDDMWLKALHNINGCMGGSKGTELTIDYRETLKLNKEIIWQE